MIGDNRPGVYPFRLPRRFDSSIGALLRAREGLVVGLSIWWKKLAPDGRNANQLTSQALTDLGGSATFYDCLVEVERAFQDGAASDRHTLL